MFVYIAHLWPFPVNWLASRRRRCCKLVWQSKVCQCIAELCHCFVCCCTYIGLLSAMLLIKCYLLTLITPLIVIYSDTNTYCTFDKAIRLGKRVILYVAEITAYLV